MFIRAFFKFLLFLFIYSFIYNIIKATAKLCVWIKCFLDPFLGNHSARSNQVILAIDMDSGQNGLKYHPIHIETPGEALQGVPNKYKFSKL